MKASMHTEKSVDSFEEATGACDQVLRDVHNETHVLLLAKDGRRTVV